MNSGIRNIQSKPLFFKIFFSLKYIKISFSDFFLFLILVNYNNKKAPIKISI
jgi:hypothetical protein